MIKTPLADQVRPQNIDDIVGQHQLLDPGAPLKSLIEKQKPLSLIFYGPPGTGKTTLANVIANEWHVPFEKFNASVDNKSTLQKLVKNHPDESFVLLLDEIHRLTKPLQDFLLPYVESGQIILIGATTENPIISISPAIRSRSALFELKPVDAKDIAKALKKIYTKLHPNHTIDDACFEKIGQYANGDVRNSINILETVDTMYGDQLTVQNIEQYAKNQGFTFDKGGDFHYNTISALQKSIRGWDTDAALYYTAVLCESGDLQTLLRRLYVIIYEDIGLADPQATAQAKLALDAAKEVGLPEARLPIAFAVILLCVSHHSNSAHDAINLAMEDAKNNQKYPIPKHLRDTHYSGSQKLGNVGYKYPHDYKNDWVLQQYLPENLQSRQYFKPHENKNTFEDKIKSRYYGFKKLQNQEFLKNFHQK